MQIRIRIWDYHPWLVRAIIVDIAKKWLQKWKCPWPHVSPWRVRNSSIIIWDYHDRTMICMLKFEKIHVASLSQIQLCKVYRQQKKLKRQPFLYIHGNCLVLGRCFGKGKGYRVKFWNTHVRFRQMCEGTF